MNDTLIRFGMSGVAGCGATFCVHPLDVVRVNLQIDESKPGSKRVYNGAFDAIRKIHSQAGIKGLYAGLSAGMLRQITYGMPRMAFYPIIVNKMQSMTGSSGNLPLWQKFICGAIAGASASILGVPSEVALVRMTSDQKLPVDHPHRRNYSGVFNAIGRIIKEEGVVTLWKGAAPTIARAVLLNAGQLAVYADLKNLKLFETLGISGIPLMFISSLGASFVATGLSCPADVIKSRMQNMQPGEFSGVVDCIRKVMQYEGPVALWKGYIPATIKLAPHTVISFIILDTLSRQILGHSHF